MSGTDDPWRGTRRDLEPPCEVWIKLAYALPPRPLPRPRVPLRVRAAGLDIAATVPGVLRAWHQTCTGEWWGLCELTITNGTGAALHLTGQLVPEAALRPATDAQAQD
ncbi:hypothetical protein ABT324_28230 [Saccharopolyspora sp. NPDC000359]|uniref:hypothetical protein n=1 Tax=Saccharopolyspora sp. NPDC000359 TaxID=3154251 RepID=UPI00332729E7